jgi:hypothetical protein
MWNQQLEVEVLPMALLVREGLASKYVVIRQLMGRILRGRARNP